LVVVESGLGTKRALGDCATVLFETARETFSPVKFFSLRRRGLDDNAVEAEIRRGARSVPELLQAGRPKISSDTP
jgi:hypothetical protein